MKDGSNIPITEGKPVRFDLSNTILKQLSKPLHSFSSNLKSSNSETNTTDCITLDVSKQNEVCKKSFNVYFYKIKVSKYKKTIYSFLIRRKRQKP